MLASTHFHIPLFCAIKQKCQMGLCWWGSGWCILAVFCLKWWHVFSYPGSSLPLVVTEWVSQWPLLWNLDTKTKTFDPDPSGISSERCKDKKTKRLKDKKRVPYIVVSGQFRTLAMFCCSSNQGWLKCGNSGTAFRAEQGPCEPSKGLVSKFGGQ